jgi:hypothetical protein
VVDTDIRWQDLTGGRAVFRQREAFSEAVL